MLLGMAKIKGEQLSLVTKNLHMLLNQVFGSHAFQAVLIKKAGFDISQCQSQEV